MTDITKYVRLFVQRIPNSNTTTSLYSIEVRPRVRSEEGVNLSVVLDEIDTDLIGVFLDDENYDDEMVE